MIGYAMCGSFCTVEASLKQMKRLADSGCDIQPFMSETLYSTSTRFGNCEDINKKVEHICGHKIIHTIPGAEPYGPAIKLDALIICPCTGNTLAKLACGITDTAICMVTKAHLRNDRPVVIALASNDALSANLKNIAALLSRKSFYFVPMMQDDPDKKPHSLVADFEQLPSTLEYALKGKQINKIII